MRLVLLLTTLLAPALRAGAQPAPEAVFEGSVRLGRAAAKTAVRVTMVDGTARLRLGKAETDLGLRAQPAVGIEEVELKGGGRVAVLRATAGEATVGALLGRPPGSRGEVLWSGRLSAHGDPGERVGHRLELADRDGDGVVDVLLGQTYERVQLCGERATLLAPHAIDPATMRLRPVSIDRVGAGGAEVPSITATTTSPGPQGAPVARLLLPVGASSSRGVRSAPEGSAPAALGDGDPQTAWHGGEGTGGRGEFVTFRWDSKHWPLRVLALRFPPTAAPASPPVDELVLVASGGTRYRVTFPQGEVASGTTYWLSLPQPLQTRCLSVLFSKAGAAGAAAGVGLADVEGYSEIDLGGAGIAGLVEGLAGSGPQAAEATRLLSRGGTAALAAVAAGWGSMGIAARGRALRVARAMATEPSAVELFARAAEDGDAGVRTAGLQGLVASETAGADARRAVLAQRGVGDQLAILLARSGDAADVATLLGALAGAAEASRAGLREALAVAVARHGAASDAVLHGWRSEPHPVDARAAVAQALAGVEVAAPHVAALVEEGLSPELEFEPLWRFVRAAGKLPTSADVDARLAKIACGDERWMMRAGALRALAARRGASLEETARDRLLDPYPRVRAVAVRSLAALGAATPALIKHARRDRWFIVRVAALESMGASPPERDAMRSAVDDRVPAVRAAAIDGLARIGDAGGWSAVRPHVDAEDEDPAVIGAGVAFARALCIKGATESLRGVVERGIKPNAWDPDRGLALHALQALQHLGGRGAVEDLISRAGPDLRTALQQRGEAPEAGGCRAAK